MCNVVQLGEPKKRGRKPGQPVRFVGLNGDAAQLGVRPSYLWAVLSGRSVSRPLLRRYSELKRVQGSAPASKRGVCPVTRPATVDPDPSAAGLLLQPITVGQANE